MKKKLLLSIITALVVSHCVYSSENITDGQKTANNSLQSTAEKENNKDETTSKHHFPIIRSIKIPTLDTVNKQLDKTSEQQTQIDSAKSISEEISNSLKNNKVIKTDIETVNQIVNVDDCIKIALANHPSIQFYRSSAEIYKSKIAQAWSDYFPKLSAGISYSRNDILITEDNGLNQKYNLFNVPTLGADMLLFDFGKSKTKADIAKKTYLASEDNVQMSINEVIFGVKKAYYSLLFAKQQEEVYEESVKDFETYLDQAKAFYGIGTKAKIDVLTAEYNLGKEKLNLIRAQNNVNLAYAEVNNKIGMPDFKDYAINENLETRHYEINEEDMLETAFRTRPEYLAAKKKAEASGLLVKGSKRAFLPDVNAFASFQAGGPRPGKDIAYKFGGNLSYENINLLLLKKQLDESKATAKRDVAELEMIRQKVYLEVQQAYLDFKNAKDSIPVAALAMIQAKEQYNLASGRYKVGLGDAIELKDAANTYRNAELDYYSNLMKYNIAVANLERVTGAPIAPEETGKSEL